MHLKIASTIQTDRLLLQRLKYEDAGEIFHSYASDQESTKFVSWPTHQSIQDTREFLNYAVSAWDRGEDYSFAIRLKIDNRLAGSIGIVNDTGKIQIGYIISPEFTGLGIATEACREIVRQIENLDAVYRIGSFVDVENHASVKVLQKAGFVEEARLKKWFRFVNQHNAPKDCILFYYPLNK